MDFPSFIPIEEEQSCPATQYNIDYRWEKMALFQDELTTNWKDHLVTFAIYATPVFGLLVKVVDGFICAICLVMPDNFSDPTVPKEDKFVDIKKRVAELQVNDFLYFAAQVVQIIFFTVIGAIESNLIVSYLVADTIFLMFLLLSRLIISERAVIDSLYRPEFSEDIKALGRLSEASKRHYTQETKGLEATKIYFERFHAVFYECVPNRTQIAKKLLSEGDLVEKIILEQPRTSFPHTDQLSLTQDWSFIRGRLLELSSL